MKRKNKLKITEEEVRNEKYPSKDIVIEQGDKRGNTIVMEKEWYRGKLKTYRKICMRM